MLASSVFTRSFILLVGLVYPGYQSYKAIQNHNIRLYTQWLIYWIIYSIFLSIEKLSDQFYNWIPFYFELKIVVTLWLVSPATKGSTRFYVSYIHPFLLHREMEIDEVIKAFNSVGYSALKKFFKYLFNLVLAAIGKAHGGVLEVIKMKYNLREVSPVSSQQGETKKIYPKDQNITPNRNFIEHSQSFSSSPHSSPQFISQQPSQYSKQLSPHASQQPIYGVPTISKSVSSTTSLHKSHQTFLINKPSSTSVTATTFVTGPLPFKTNPKISLPRMKESAIQSTARLAGLSERKSPLKVASYYDRFVNKKK